MLHNIDSSLEEVCPIKTLTIPVNSPKWLNRDIIELMRDRDAAYRRARKHNNPDDWNLAKFYRNRTEEAINYNKSKYMKEFFYKKP